MGRLRQYQALAVGDRQDMGIDGHLKCSKNFGLPRRRQHSIFMLYHHSLFPLYVLNCVLLGKEL